MSACAPILMIGFNRPELSHRLLEHVRKARPRKLFWAVDGARENNERDQEAVKVVRGLVKEIDWPCEVETYFQSKNRGCGHALSEAITWFFSKVEYGIILEDDILPSQDFFEFATQILIRYKDNNSVGAVSGFNPFEFQTIKTDSYHFSTHLCIWGWGSWARVWKDYSLDVSQYESELSEIANKFGRTRRARSVFLQMAHALNDNLDTWDIQFSIMFAAKQYLCVVPRFQLTGNIGLEQPEATHTRGYLYDAHKYGEIRSMEFPLCHPKDVALDERCLFLRECRENAILPRALTWIGCKITSSKIRRVISIFGRILENRFPLLFRI